MSTQLYSGLSIQQIIAQGVSIIMNVDASGNTIDSFGGGGTTTTVNGISPTVTIAGAGSNTVITAGSTITISGSASGNVTGPASSTNYNVALWNGTTGQLLQDSNLNYSGGTLHQSTGDLTISNPSNLILTPSAAVKFGAPLLPTADSTYDVGSAADGILDIYANSIIAPTSASVLSVFNNNASGKITLGITGVDEVYITSTSMAPQASGTYNLGTSATPWNDVYANSFIGDVVELNFVIDGAGSVIASGSAGFIEVPYNAKVLEWDFLGNISGSIQCDVQKSTYTSWSGTGHGTSITSSQTPNIISAYKGQNTNPNLWSGISAGDILEFVVASSPTTVTRATLALKLQKLS